MNKAILRLALPSILANITVSVVGMVDLAVAGHIDPSIEGFSDAATLIGGVALGSMLFDLLYWNFGFLRAGTGGFTAQAYGRGDFRDAGRMLVRGIALALISALAIIAIQWPFSKAAMLLADSSEDIRKLALDYFFIRIWAAPATLSLFSLKGWFIGMQDSVSSMLTDLVINVVNVAASLVLSLGIGSWEGIGFTGIAVGTLLAQYTGFVFALSVVWFKYRAKVFGNFSSADLREALQGRGLRTFMSVNGDLFVRSMALVVIYVGFTALSSRCSDQLFSVCAILMKVLMVFSYFTDGFAYAGEALVGRYVGERNPVLLRRTVRYVYAWSMGIGMFFVLIYGLAGEPCMRLMTSDIAVVEASRPYLWWLMVMPLLGCPAFTWDGIFVGATKSKALRNSTLAAIVGFFGFWALGTYFTDFPAVHVLMFAYFVHLLTRTMWLTVSYFTDFRSFVPDI